MWEGYTLMKWVKSFREQGQICEAADNRFLVRAPSYKGEIVVCVPFKTFCHSEACREKRYPEGEKEEGE